MSAEISKVAYRYAVGIYVLFGLFAFYCFRELGIFLATHYLPENASGFSLANPNFSLMNTLIGLALAAIVVVALFANERLKEYIVDVGDELTRVSFADLKETQKSTVIVLGLCISAAVFLFVADQIFLKIVNFILSFAG